MKEYRTVAERNTKMMPERVILKEKKMCTEKSHMTLSLTYFDKSLHENKKMNDNNFYDRLIASPKAMCLQITVNQ